MVAPKGLSSSNQDEFGLSKPFLDQQALEQEKQRAENEARRRRELDRRLNALSPQGRYQEELQRAQSFKAGAVGAPTETISDEAGTISAPDTQTQREILAPLVPPSTIEQIFSGLYPSEVSKDLKQFGYDLFNAEVANFTPLYDVPVSKDYVLGPGDTFTINVWGSNNFSHSVTVRADGSIFIPKIGTIAVWGKTFSQATRLIEKRLSDFFSGIKVNIAFDSIRSIDVFVVGEVHHPGRYTISSTSAVINALFHAGGPTKNGSLRQIKIMRENKEVATVDLYEFLIDGKINQQKLQSQDVILVPVIGKLAAIAGHAKRPGIYEWHQETTLYDLLMMAGGLKFTGYAGRLSLERVRQNRERITKDYNIPENISRITRAEALKTELAAKIEDGDLVSIFSILPERKGTVRLRGHVHREGAYEFKPGMRVSDVVKSFNDLKPEPYTQYVQIIRTVPPKDEKRSVFTSLDEIFKGNEAYNIALEDRDEIVVFSKEELNLREKVSIFGKVNRPGEYVYFSGMTLQDLIFMAGNLTQDAYKASAEIARFQLLENEMKADRIQVDLREVLSANPSANPKLEPKDRVSVYGLPNFEVSNYIDLEGEVQFPGRYSFLPGERLSSILKRAGGFTSKAFLEGAVFTRSSVKELQQQSLKEQITRLEEAILYEAINPGDGSASSQAMANQNEAIAARRALLRNLESAQATGRMILELEELDDFKGSRQDITLEGGDRLVVPLIPSVVNVMGEVFNQTSVVFVKGETVEYYLSRAGGITQNGDESSIFIIRANGSVVSKQQNRGFLLRDFMRTRIERGDTILVPKDISRFSWLATTKDITEILFKIASTTGITITAFK